MKLLSIFNKLRYITPLLIVLIMILYNNVNLISIIIGSIVIVIGESKRIKILQAEEGNVTLANGIVYSGLVILANTIFPWFLLFTIAYYYTYQHLEKKYNSKPSTQKPEIQKLNFSEKLKLDKLTIQALSFIVISFVFIWGLRRL